MELRCVAIGVSQSEGYASEALQRQVVGLRVTCGMSRTGSEWDSAVMESLFSTLMIERRHRRRRTSRDRARADNFAPLVRVDVSVRRHITRGFCSPIALELAAAVALA
jgi:putative transposase